ncbi:hypothetical protein IMX26_00065 [Clostridium sp. 'deep sea']|uniref:hypothetical protein n=1 Tax=Clostridium sp. 'deep sea' TaxID=2779445 RepID=UPI0018967A0A|nr:hypothetical protein [Clostridium sp. 'deep sea']QOR35271.1 hypothetical protein IMX26_00065 [Clostridium sp. 'deep sea']
MLNLIKYEFMKKYKMFIAILITTVLGNAFFTIKFGELGFGPLAAFLAFGLLILYVVDVIQMYNKDIFKKTGYMVFMTPNSGYKIIISKIITALLEGFLMLFFYLAVLTLNNIILYGDISDVVILNMTVPLGTFLQFLLIALVAAILYLVHLIMVVYSAITLGKSIFANSKYKGLICFGFFLVIGYLTTNAYWILYRSLNFQISGSPIPAQFLKVCLPSMLLSAVFCTVFIAGSGYLLEKKINL